MFFLFVFEGQLKIWCQRICKFFAWKIQEIDKKRHVQKKNFRGRSAFLCLRPTSAGSRAEAGRQNFERIPAAIRGRKKPFANRIREFDICRGLKRVKTEFILTKRISENLPPNPGGTRAEAGRQNFDCIPAAIRGRKKPFANRIRELNSSASMHN